MPSVHELWPVRIFTDHPPRRKEPKKPGGDVRLAWDEQKTKAEDSMKKFRASCRMTKDQMPDTTDQELVVIMLTGIRTARTFQARRYLPQPVRDDYSLAASTYAEDLAAYLACKAGRETPAYLSAAETTARAFVAIDGIETHNNRDNTYLYQARILGPVSAMKLARSSASS